MEANRTVRPVQLKSSYKGGKTSRQKVHIKLSEKPSGCVIWVYFDEDEKDVKLGPFYFFGGMPGEPLPPINDTKVARHTKGNRDCYKADRPNIRELTKGNFAKYETIEEIYHALFGNKNA